MYDYVVEDFQKIPMANQVGGGIDVPPLPEGTDCLVTGGMQAGVYVVVRGSWYLIGSLHPHRSYGVGYAPRRRLGLGEVAKNRVEAVFGTVKPRSSDDPHYIPPPSNPPTGPQGV